MIPAPRPYYNGAHGPTLGHVEKVAPLPPVEDMTERLYLINGRYQTVSAPTDY